jgi:hypothetical protein
MPFVLQVNDVCEWKWYGHSQGQYSINVRHYRVTAITGDSQSDGNLLSALVTKFAGAIRACMSEHSTHVAMSLQIIRNIRRPMVIDYTGAGVGTFAGESLPRQVAGLIKLTSEEATRHGRGRTYVPFPSEGANDVNGFPTGAYVDALHNLALLMDDSVSVGDVDTITAYPVIYNRSTHGVTTITTATERQEWATQRRRSDIRGGDKPPL